MKSYKVVSKSGKTSFISARTYSEAFQKAVSFCGDDLIEIFEEV